MKNLFAHFHPLAFALLLLLAVSPTRAADAPPQGDLRSLILNAVASGQKRLVIAPGVYRVSPQGNEGTLIFVHGARDLEIVADGVTMVCTKRMRALSLDACRNVTLRGLKLDYDPLTFTQGKVVAMADDKGFLDIQIDAGYPQYLASRIVICDPKTRFHKYGIDHLWGTKASWASLGVVRITRPDVARNVDLGDLVALSDGQEIGNCHGITVENGCSNVVLRDVSIFCAPGMGLVDFNNETGIKMFGCKIVPGPRPAGATQDRLLSTSWDGIQCNVARVGPQIEGCIIERCGDDSWSVPTRELKVVEQNGKTVLLSAPDGSPENGGLRVGDHLVGRTEQQTFTQPIETTQTVKREVDGKTKTLIEVTFARKFPVQAGQFMFNADCGSRGFIYRNNRITSHGRGALVKVSDGLIEGNTFRACDKAIMVDSELPAGAGIIDRLVIRGNTILETGYHQAMPWSEQAGAICLGSSVGGGKLRSPGVFNDVLIENNTFDRVKGLNLLIASAQNVRVKNNRFLHTHTTEPGRHNGADYGIDATAVIEITQSDGVVLRDNTVQMGPFGKVAVRVEPSAVNVLGVETTKP